MTFTQLSDLDGFKTGGFSPSYAVLPLRTFYSPVDDVHGALLAVVGSAKVSLTISMFGFDDPALADLVEAAMSSPSIAVTLVLDKSQAGGVHEREILAHEDYPATWVAIGTSEHSAIIHLKEVVVDGRWRISGSTNWSSSGEDLQDNEMTVIDSQDVAMEADARIKAVFASIRSREKS